MNTYRFKDIRIISPYTNAFQLPSTHPERPDIVVNWITTTHWHLIVLFQQEYITLRTIVGSSFRQAIHNSLQRPNIK